MKGPYGLGDRMPYYLIAIAILILAGYIYETFIK